MKLAKGMLLAALAAWAVASPSPARATGKIRSVDVYDPEGVHSFPNPQAPLAAGDTFRVRFRLVNLGWAQTVWDASYANPWVFRYTGPLTGDAEADERTMAEAEKPRLGLWIGGQLREADCANWPMGVASDWLAELLDGERHYTDLIFEYRVRPGDLALPVQLANEAGTGPAKSGDRLYLKCNGRETLWKMVDARTHSATNELAFGPSNLYDDPDFAGEDLTKWRRVNTPDLENLDFNLSGADVHVRGVDFDPAFFDGDAGVWRSIAQGSTAAEPAAPSIRIGNDDGDGALDPLVLYLWTADTNVAEIAVGDAVDDVRNYVFPDGVTRKVGRLRVAQGDKTVPFGVKATGAVGAATQLFLAPTPTNILDAAGDIVANFLVRTVRVGEPIVAYSLWVGGVQVFSTNRTDILGDGTASFEGTATNGTLSLSNATITATYAFEDAWGFSYSANVLSGEGFDLTISLTGTNILQNAEDTSGGRHDYGVRSRGNLAITGGGALVAGTNYDGAGIDTDGDLLVDGADVTAHSWQYGISVGGGLAISNAVVTAHGDGYDGISSNGDIVIADSVVTATGWAGIYAHDYTITVSGASVVTAEATWDEESEWALGAEALVLRDGLAVSEPAGGALGEDEWGTKCVLDPATDKAALRVVIDRRFAVTVVDGSTTNTTARAGETVTVVANAPAEGEGFVEWSADDAMDLSFATAAATTTTFAMPARAVTVTAVFKEIQIASIPDQEWTGGPVEPEFRSDTVKFEGTDMVLLPGTDYTVSYTNNVDPGTATAMVTMAPPRTGHASATFQILPPPEPPAVSNVVARQRWPWNGLVDVDYEVGGDTNLLAGVTARITFEERIEGGTGRIWVASNFLAGAEPSVEPGPHRATWDTAADGVTDVVAEVKATVNLVGTGNEKGLELVNKTVIVTPVDPASEPSCVVVNGNGYLLTNDPEGVGIDFRFGSGCDSAKLGDVVGITLDPEKVKEFFGTAESLQFVPSEGVKLVDPTTGNKVDSLEENADGSVVFFVTADQVVPGGSIEVFGDGKTVVIDNINFYDSVPEGWVGVVVTSAASAAFRLDTREGPFESDGTETLTYSSIWHGDTNATVTILQDGDEDEPVSSGLLDEGDAVWQVFEDGTYVLTHVTTTNVAVSPVCNEETATFVVTGHPPVEAALRWKYAKNANGWHCAQVALKWHPSFAREISDMRLLFADRYEDEEPLAVIKVLDDDQAAFFEVPEMIKMAGDDWKYYFLNDENGKVYTERFLEGGYREKLVERPTVINGDEAGTLTSWGGSDDRTCYITNGVLNADGTSFSGGITVNGRTVTLKFASSPRGLGRRTAYLVDPATVLDPLGTTETYRDAEYRVAPVDLSGFAGLADGARAVYGVSDETMDSSLDSVPRAERLICLRVANRDYSTVGRVDNKLAILAWKVGGLPRFLPIAETMSSLQDGGGVHQPAQQPAPRPLSVEEANLSAAFGLAPAAVARGAVTCRVSSMSFGEDGSVEGTFAVAAENAGRVVAESGELAGNVKFTVLGAERLGGAFEPLDPSCGAELLSRKPPYAFRVKSPGKNAFFKIRLEADDLFE